MFNYVNQANLGKHPTCATWQAL